MKNLFSIGEVSRYQNISKQTLIFYDKIDLFKPAYVDPDNGYRYYSVYQLDYLDTILIMKKIGFSLKEIREHMRQYTIDRSLIAFRGQLSVIDQKIEELKLIRSRVGQRCAQMESAMIHAQKKDAVVIENVSTSYILYRNVAKPYRLQDISIATKQCFTDAFQKKLPIFFQSGVKVPLTHILRQRYTEATLAFLPIEKTDQDPCILQLPAGTCATFYHVGDYESIGQSYQQLLAYCKQNALQIVSDSYELCINDYLTSRDENEYITKIMFYVQPADNLL